MNKTPLVSIIIPVYNVEKYLERCIQSVRSQTYNNIEIILIDDGSPDNSPMICDRFRELDERIIVVHKKNGGLSDARNAGVQISKGDYITFIDSDDLVSEDYISYLLNLCEKNGADISCCNYLRFSDDLPVDTIKYQEKSIVLSPIETCEGLFSQYYDILVTACWKLYKSSIIKSYPFPVGYTHEDEATTFKFYYNANRTVIGNKPCYKYYQNPNSITKSEKKLNGDTIWALNYRIECLISWGELELAKNAAYILMGYLCNCYLIDEKNTKKYMRAFERKYIKSNYMKFKHKIRFELVYRVPSKFRYMFWN